MRSLICLLAIAVQLSACDRQTEVGDVADNAADVVLNNGKVVTVDDDQPEAQAVAIRDGRILAVGTNDSISSLIGEGTEVLDLNGRLAIPGFIEGHGHFMGVGNAQMILDLTTPRTWDDIVALVEDAVTESEPGTWIYGRGWHQDKWTSRPSPNFEGFPLHNSLSAVSPNNPVVLTHASGHASFVNAKAMEMAGIDAGTPDPPGGEILKDSDGRPTGLMRETAQGVVRRADAGPSTAEQIETRMRLQAQLAAEESLSKGITSFQDAGVSFRTVDFYKQLVDEGALPLRLWVMIRTTNDDLAANLGEYRMIGYGDDRLTVRAIKLSIDGALGSRGAWLLEPYSDARHLSGLNLVPIPDVKETARLALAHDYQLGVHAIGDRANREVLDIYEAAFAGRTMPSDLRWRIEHAQHLSLADIPRFAGLGVIASMQGVHCTSDAPWVPDRLGDRRSEEGAYVWQKLMASGAIVTNGTDAPVEDVDPIASYYATVSRRLNDGSVFYPDQRMSRLEALKSYTINNAFAAFEEDLKGSITPGKLADIVVLDRDIMTVPEDEILSTKVDMTIVGGELVYSR